MYSTYLVLYVDLIQLIVAMHALRSKQILAEQLDTDNSIGAEVNEPYNAIYNRM